MRSGSFATSTSPSPPSLISLSVVSSPWEAIISLCASRPQCGGGGGGVGLQTRRSLAFARIRSRRTYLNEGLTGGATKLHFASKKTERDLRVRLARGARAVQVEASAESGAASLLSLVSRGQTRCSPRVARARCREREKVCGSCVCVAAPDVFQDNRDFSRPRCRLNFSCFGFPARTLWNAFPPCMEFAKECTF